jgi:hypothetical protein
VLKDTGTEADIDINGIGGIIIRNRRRPADAASAHSTTRAASPPMAQPSRPLQIGNRTKEKHDLT